jgi:lipopolysaccharide/colanic/teichoic acid biosynthesis glycosyltransferase
MDGSSMRIVGLLDDYHPVGTRPFHRLQVLGRTSSLMEVAHRYGAHDVLVMPQALPWETLTHLITSVAIAPGGPRLHLGAGFYELLTASVRYSTFSHLPLLSIGKARMSRPQAAVKLALDYTVALTLLLLSSPAIALMVCWQRMRGESRLLERRAVLGRDARPFTLISFRSSAPFDSPFLRKLPGLLNVLARHLSIVGPRPADSGGGARAMVDTAGLRPGLTGPWRAADDPAAQAVLDLFYVRAYSIALDVNVLWRRMRSRLPGSRRNSAPAGAVLSMERSA